MTYYNYAHRAILEDVFGGLSPHENYSIFSRGHEVRRAPEPELTELLKFGHLNQVDSHYQITPRGVRLLRGGGFVPVGAPLGDIDPFEGAAA